MSLLRLQKELVERDAAVRLGDSKLLERIRTLEVEADENDEYCEDLEQQLEQLGAEKGSLQMLVGELQVRPSLSHAVVAIARSWVYVCSRRAVKERCLRQYGVSEGPHAPIAWGRSKGTTTSRAFRGL